MHAYCAIAWCGVADAAEKRSPLCGSLERPVKSAELHDLLNLNSFYENAKGLRAIGRWLNLNPEMPRRANSDTAEDL